MSLRHQLTPMHTSSTLHIKDQQYVQKSEGFFIDVWGAWSKNSTSCMLDSSTSPYFECMQNKLQFPPCKPMLGLDKRNVQKTDPTYFPFTTRTFWKEELLQKFTFLIDVGKRLSLPFLSKMESCQPSMLSRHHFLRYRIFFSKKMTRTTYFM